MSARGVARGLRARIAVVITLVVLVAVAALGVAVHLLVVAEHVDAVRDAADGRILAAMEIYDRTGLLSFDATVDDPSVPAQLRDAVPADGDRATLVTGGAVRTVRAAGRTEGVVLSTTQEVRAADSGVAAVDRALLLAGAVVVLLAGLVGRVTAGRLARRLRTAAATARDVAAGGDPTSLRRVVGERRDEVGDLADAVDAMAARLAARVEAEQRFTADVAHDLRTPVTGLLTAAELLEDSRPAALVRDRAHALATLVEELLEVARLDGGQEEADVEDVDLADVVGRAVRRGVAAGELDPSSVVVSTDAATHVLTDPRRVDRVLTNLVRNALEHGSPPVEVTQEGLVVTVRDHGPGFDAALVADGPRRLRRGPAHRGGGHGLGLVIAQGQAAILGASLRFDNHPDGGARARIELPPDPAAGSGHGRPTGTSRNGDRTGASS